MKKHLPILTLLLCSFNFIQAQERVTLEKQKNVQFITAINLGFTSDLNQPYLVGTVSNGIQIKKRTQVLLGLGMEGSGLGKQLPIFLEGKYAFFKKNPKSPFVSLTAGYLQAMQRENYNGKTKGGFMTGAYIGYQNFFSEHVGISTSVGYRYTRQESTGYPPYWYFLPYEYNPNDKYIHVSNRLELRISLMFK